MSMKLANTCINPQVGADLAWLAILEWLDQYGLHIDPGSDAELVINDCIVHTLGHANLKSKNDN